MMCFFLFYEFSSLVRREKEARVCALYSLSFKQTEKWNRGTQKENSSGAPCDRERKAGKDSSHGPKHRATLFAHRGEIAADDAKGSGSLGTAKRPGNLLLNFDHSQIPLREIIAKRHRKIIQETEHLFCPRQKSIEQIFGGVLFCAPALR